jgi:hypothetical protein
MINKETMSKIVLTKLSGNNDLAQLNNNFQKIADTLNEDVLFRNNPEGEPNHLTGTLDLDGNSIVNVTALNVSQNLAINGVDILAQMDVVNEAIDLINEALPIAESAIETSQAAVAYIDDVIAQAEEEIDEAVVGAQQAAEAAKQYVDAAVDVARDEADRAEGYATSLNLPPIAAANAGQMLQVNSSGTGYELITKASLRQIMFPIGDVRVQFPGEQAPNALYGGTWVQLFQYEGVFFRTEGADASGFGGGIQSDAVQNFNGSLNEVIFHGNNGGSGDGLFAVEGPNTGDAGMGASNANRRRVTFDAGRQLRVANETRPRNRTMRIWRKTAH